MMQRILGAIERGGNKMPNPAILFVWLCVIVIVLSALLAWADIKVTYQVVEPPPVPVEEVVQGGSTQPSGGLPDASVQEGEYTVRRRRRPSRACCPPTGFASSSRRSSPTSATSLRSRSSSS